MTAKSPAPPRLPDPARLPVPQFGGGSLADVVPGLLAGLGVADAPEHETPAPVPVQDRVCLLLVDGLGWTALDAQPALAPFLSSLRAGEGSGCITTVFPSTTPIALTSLGTGLAPGEHGVTGLLLRLDDGRLVNTLALPEQTDMQALQPRPTCFERAVAAGIRVSRVGPAAFDGQGLTRAALRGGSYRGAETVGERVAAAAAEARGDGPSLTYVYLGDLDAAGHRRGCSSEAWRAELRHVDRVVEQLAESLPPGTTLVVTSDHGMVDLDVTRRWDVAHEPVLDAGVAAVSGDLRAAYVHARPGAAPDVLAAWSETLAGDCWVLPTQEAVEAGLFGSVRDHVRPRLGDLVVAARGAASVVDSRVTDRRVLGLVGMHGSLTPDELLVPLLVHQR